LGSKIARCWKLLRGFQHLLGTEERSWEESGRWSELTFAGLEQSLPVHPSSRGRFGDGLSAKRLANPPSLSSPAEGTRKANPAQSQQSPKLGRRFP
jgi:hypothetical protein